MHPVFPARPADRYGILLDRLIDGQDWPRVLETSRAWLSEEPENAVAHRVVGQALVNLERYEEARSHLAKALAAQPQNSFAHRLASIAAFHLKDFDRADEHIQRAIELQPTDAFHWHHLASMRYRQGALEAAAKHAHRALELQPNNPNLINLLALCENGDATTQYQRYRRALELDPENSAVHNNVGVYHLNVDKDYAQAEACFRQALRLDPTDRTAQKNLLLVLRHRDRVYQALRLPLTLVEKISWGRKGRGTVARVGLILLWVTLGRYFWALLILWALLIYPLQKVYEYLTLGDIQAQAGVLGARRGGLFGYRRWPFAVRFGLLALLTLAFWGAVFEVVRHAAALSPTIAGALIGLTAISFGVYYLVRWGRRSGQRWRIRRSEKRFSSRMETADR